MTIQLLQVYYLNNNLQLFVLLLNEKKIQNKLVSLYSNIFIFYKIIKLNFFQKKLYIFFSVYLIPDI